MYLTQQFDQSRHTEQSHCVTVLVVAIATKVESFSTEPVKHLAG